MKSIILISVLITLITSSRAEGEQQEEKKAAKSASLSDDQLKSEYKTKIEKMKGIAKKIIAMKPEDKSRTLIDEAFQGAADVATEFAWFVAISEQLRESDDKDLLVPDAENSEDQINLIERFSNFFEDNVDDMQKFLDEKGLLKDRETFEKEVEIEKKYLLKKFVELDVLPKEEGEKKA